MASANTSQNGKSCGNKNYKYYYESDYVANFLSLSSKMKYGDLGQ